MLSNLTGMHFFVILFVVLLLFGAPKLPGLARSLGQSMKILKTEIGPNGSEDTAAAPAPAAPAAPAAAAAPANAPATAADRAAADRTV